MHPEQIDIEACARAFAEEMGRGLSGAPSSLLMLPTYLSPEGRPKDGETAIAVDIGGTNLRVALTAYRSGRLEVLWSDVSPVPGSRGTVTKDAFFAAIADKLTPVIGKSGRVGVSFSHSAEILPNRDGRLISFSKEISVTDAAGMEICHELERKIIESGCREKKSFVLLNDTVAVLLSGAAAVRPETCDGFMGLVLGTGMNMCYTERAVEIMTLRGDYTSGAMIVNTEAGNFDKIPFGEPDRALDSRTANPGDHLMEKAMLTHLLDSLYERGARLVVSMLAGAMLKTDPGRDENKPVCVAAEGSTFYKLHSFKERVYTIVRSELNGRLGRYCEIIRTENASIEGTALAAMLNG
jgi:hexokinase